MPNANSAVVRDAKVRDYLLDPAHRSNGGKAHFFDRFGYNSRNWRALRDALKAHPLSNLVVAVTPNAYGTVYEVRCNLRTPDGRNPCIRSIWVIDLGATIPQFVTAYAFPP